MRPEPRREEGVRVGAAVDLRRERGARDRLQRGRGRPRGPTFGLFSGDGSRGNLEAAEGVEGVVLRKAVQAGEIDGFEPERRWRRRAHRSDWVSIRRQLGSRERTSRTNVQRSRWSATSVAEPSTTSPALSRVTEASLLAKRMPT